MFQMTRRAPLLLALLAVATPAAAAPLSSGPVRVAPDGKASVDGKPVGTLDLPASPRKLSHSFINVAGRRLIRLRVKGRSDQSAEMLLMAPPDLRSIFSGRTGPRGVDGEWSQLLKVSQGGILLYQRREGVERCDGGPVYLFPRMYDFAAARFRPVAAVGRVEGLTTLVASRSASNVPQGGALNTFRLAAASTQQGDEGLAANLSPPSEADDGKLDTAWSEGLGGAGQGEFLTARAEPSPYRLKAISLIPGDAADATSFRKANRLKSVLLLLSPVQRYRISFAVDPLRTPGQPADPFWVLLPQPISTTCATVVVESVYPGTVASGGKGQGRTAISELHFYTELEFGGGLKQVAKDLESPSLERGAGAVQILARLGAQGITVVERVIARRDQHPDVLKRALKVLVRVQRAEAAGPLASLLSRLPGPQRVDALDALIAIGPPAVPHLVKGLGQAGPVLAGAARVLGRIGGDRARDALLARVGAGDEQRRSNLAHGLASLRRPEDLEAVLTAAAAATDSTRKADLVLVAGRIGAQTGDAGATAARLASLWPAGDLFELRYRIIAAVGRLSPGRQLPLLLRTTKDPDPVLRWLCVEQIRKVPDEAATRSLRALLADSDPRVRASAALSLGRRPVHRATGLALARRLRGERWTQVARALAESLGRQCLAEGLAVLRKRLVSGPRGVDIRALISIASCAPPKLDRELFDIARGASWRLALRRRALDLLTPKMARARAADLRRLYLELRTRAARSEDDEALAVSVSKVLAVAGTGEAAEALADALALDPHESIRAAAASALGRLCHRSSARTLKQGTKDASGAVRRASRRALKRCRF